MNIKKILIPVFVVGVLSGCNQQQEKAEALTYPDTKKVDHVDSYFGEDVADPYRWLEDDNSEETAKWVQAENDVTFSYLDQIDFRQALKDRLETLIDYEKVSAPFEEGEYTYWYKNDGLQNHSVLYRKKTGTENEEVYMDANSFAEDGTVALRGSFLQKMVRLKLI